MSVSRNILRRLPPPKPTVLRQFCTSSTKSSHRHIHDYQSPSSYINSWKPSQNPKEAEAHLAFLRRDYARKVKQIRKSYIEEMELQRLEKLRKDEAKKEALRIVNEERKAVKTAKKKAEAIEREAVQEEFRQMLMKERAAKLEYWKTMEKKFEEKKKEKNELLRKQSSLWIDESRLERTILEAMVDKTPL